MVETYWEVSGRIKSETLDEVDEFGNIYYFYMDCDEGNVYVEVRQVVDGQGNIAYRYEPDKTGYQNADISDPANPKVW